MRRRTCRQAAHAFQHDARLRLLCPSYFSCATVVSGTLQHSCSRQSMREDFFLRKRVKKRNLLLVVCAPQLVLLGACCTAIEHTRRPPPVHESCSERVCHNCTPNLRACRWGFVGVSHLGIRICLFALSLQLSPLLFLGGNCRIALRLGVISFAQQPRHRGCARSRTRAQFYAMHWCSVICGEACALPDKEFIFLCPSKYLFRLRTLRMATWEVPPSFCRFPSAPALLPSSLLCANAKEVKL